MSQDAERRINFVIKALNRLQTSEKPSSISKSIKAKCNNQQTIKKRLSSFFYFFKVVIKLSASYIPAPLFIQFNVTLDFSFWKSAVVPLSTFTLLIAAVLCRFSKRKTKKKRKINHFGIYFGYVRCVSGKLKEKKNFLSHFHALIILFINNLFINIHQIFPSFRLSFSIPA